MDSTTWYFNPSPSFVKRALEMVLLLPWKCWCWLSLKVQFNFTFVKLLMLPFSRIFFTFPCDNSIINSVNALSLVLILSILFTSMSQLPAGNLIQKWQNGMNLPNAGDRTGQSNKCQPYGLALVESSVRIVPLLYRKPKCDY